MFILNSKRKCKDEKKSRYRLMLPVIGFVSLIWYLFRVAPKPSRASYPCQRVAAPLAGGFLLWLGGLLGSIALFRKAKYLFKSARFGPVFGASILLAAAGVLMIVNMPEQEIAAAVSVPNAPVGIAKGIHPGRVVWVYDPDATDWDGFDSSDHWYESSHTDLAVVEKMFSRMIRGIAGESTDAAAWDAIFKYSNSTRGRGATGYKASEKIVVKLNLTTCNYMYKQVDPKTYNKNSDVLNRIDNSPQMVLALLRHLVNTVGAAQEDITIGDPTGMVPNYYWNMLHIEFPNINYWDNYGGSGRTRAEFSSTPIYWSTGDDDGKLQDYLPRAIVDADYMINFAILKGHSSGVTLCAKNHYGSLIRAPNGYYRDEGTLNYYNLHDSLPNAQWSPGTGKYRALVDLAGHPEIGGKTALYLIDGLFGGYYWDAVPRKWTSSPFGASGSADWPSSMFGSLDPVAIDSVAYDFLLEEWPLVVTTGGGSSLQGGAEDYLHEAAQADSPPSGTFYDPDNDGAAMTSLGVHEHWNNDSQKQYSRNLGTGDGIELFRISNTSGGNSEISINRDHIYFGAIAGGAPPGGRSLNISNISAGDSSWVVSESISWLSCTPSAGNNDGLVTLSPDTTGMTAGKYTGTVTVTNLNSSSPPLTVAVTMTIYARGSDAVPFGSFDTPLSNTTISSSVPVTGWVLDDVEVESVKIYRQQGGQRVYIGDANFVEGARPDVETAYQIYPDNYKAGWGYMMLTNFLPGQGNGTFTFYAVARDSSGHEVDLGSKTVTCDNANAVKPFGAIETPTQGGPASGNEFINWGWVLTPQPNSLPTDGSTIDVYVDGVKVGNPVYNIYREDIDGFFPGYANSKSAVGYFYLDTTKYANGIHTIYWAATDSGGNTDGIGSRFFNIQNSGSTRQKSIAISAQQWQKALPLLPGAKRGAVNGTVKIKELERMEIHNEGAFAAFLVVGGELRDLPAGSTFDPGSGRFLWSPGPGHYGKYKLLFLMGDEAGQTRKRTVDVIITARFPF